MMNPFTDDCPDCEMIWPIGRMYRRCSISTPNTPPVWWWLTQRLVPAAPAINPAARALVPRPVAVLEPLLPVAVLAAAYSWREVVAIPRKELMAGVADSAQAAETGAELALILASAAGAAHESLLIELRIIICAMPRDDAAWRVPNYQYDRHWTTAVNGLASSMPALLQSSRIEEKFAEFKQLSQGCLFEIGVLTLVLGCIVTQRKGLRTVISDVAGPCASAYNLLSVETLVAST